MNRPVMAHIVAVLAVMAGAWFGVLALLDLLAEHSSDPGFRDPVGAGLTALMLLAAISGVVGAVGGWWVSWSALWAWPFAGLLVSGLSSYRLADEDGDVSAATWAAETFGGTGVFLAGCVVAPAVVGVLLGVAIRGMGSAQARPQR